MSLILEALRKSEAERRRGQTPDLLSDATVVAPAARAAARNAGAMIAVAVAALLTLLLVAWWLRPTAVEPGETMAKSADPAPTGTSPASPAPAQSQAIMPEPASPPPTTTTAIARPSATLTPPRSPPQSAPADREAETTPANTARMPVAIEPETGPAPIASAVPAPPAKPPAESAPPAFTSPDTPLRLSDLSTEERQQLPALKVSMHMWAAETANRFAIIDGARVNEGDRVGEATVAAIQQDGVLLAWRGRQIRLPIR